MTIGSVEEGIRLVQQAQSDYQASLLTHKEAQKEYSEEGRDRVYRRVAKLNTVANNLMTDKAILGGIYAQLSILPRTGTNPYWYVVKAICRKPKKGGGTTFDTSAGKWANSLRYFAEHEWGADEEAIYARLKTHTEVVRGVKLGGLKATEAADRASHNETDEVQAFQDAAFEDLMDRNSDVVLPAGQINVEGATDGMFVSAVFQLKEGEWLLRGVSDAGGDAARRSISKRVVADFKRRHDEMLYELAKANDEVRQRNDWSPGLRRIFASREERRLAVEHPLDPAMWQEPRSVTEGDGEEEHQLVLASQASGGDE